MAFKELIKDYIAAEDKALRSELGSIIKKHEEFL